MDYTGTIPGDNSFINIRNIKGDVNSLKSNNVNFIKVDKDQNIWTASDRGVSRLQKQSMRFYNFTFPGGRIDLSTVFHAGEKDFVVITNTKKNETAILISPITPGRLDSLRFETITVIKNNSSNPTIPGLSTPGIWQGKHNLWISVYGKGIVRLSINPESGMIVPGNHEVLSHEPENQNTISSNSTTFVWEDSHENVWVGTRGSGLNKINQRIPYGREGSVVRYRRTEQDPNSLSNDFVWHFFPENEKSFWVTTETGVDLFRNNRFEHILKYKNNPTSIYVTPKGNLLIGGVDGLHEGKKQGDNYTFSQDPFFKKEDIVRIQEDRMGRLWIFNTKGTVCYDRDQQITVEFNEKDGFDHTRAITTWYRENQTSRGIMVISDYDGLTLFNPMSLSINRSEVYPVLTRLTVNNHPPFVGKIANTKEKFSIKSDISVLDELILDYQHNNFSLEFSGMQMIAPEKNRYRHKLQGYDKDWIETDWKNRLATYTNLDAGNYIFKVRASNHHGIWSEQEATLFVRILPPPWKTWWAYSLYGLALISILLYWRRYENNRLKLKHRAAYLGELDNLKTRFFANISHEFRTPISLILGPLKEMCTGTFRGDPKPAMEIMMRNGQRLLRLINQLLDLSKIEASKIQLQTTSAELVQFLREIASSYESLAAEKKIRYFFHPEVHELMVYVDEEKIEKVIHNILSNAFKFTKAGGEIILNLKTEDKFAVIAVRDTGIGIPDNQLDKVFDRFYQVDSSQTRGCEGSGLGMALAKELVELHHGRISVESKEGTGTTFTVWIPLGIEHLSKKEISGSEDLKKTKVFSKDQILSEHAVEPENEKTTVSSDHPVLLIVEDNADMRNYIRKTLSEYYHIHEAANGKEGVKKAQEIIPDLIISDVMMPQMDGYQLCEKIKTRELTSHIPVILLTAKADRESKLSGLEIGADDYLSKPFDAAELRLIVRNRIEEKRKMRERFSREITLEPTQVTISSMDEKFLQKVLALIETHMEDENFSIEDFSNEAGYSKMQFYRKIKALAGQTPSVFVRTVRLKRAAELLRKKSDNISQIAYTVGFGSVSYFNKCFKEQFGVTPGEFGRESLKPQA